ncbi:MAG TPA: methyltransferase domain-containing protein [Dongiaceae bacterium]
MQPGEEYDEAMVAALELVWGDGFLSPGGPAEIAEILKGSSIAGKRVLDIGCGIGGVDLLLVEAYDAAHVTGIDIEAPNITLASKRAEQRGLADCVSYRLVEPGPLPFPDASLDVVFSKDAMIHIPDKDALFEDVFRVLRPGGLFLASDWLRGDDKPASTEMQHYVGLEGLSFVMASPARYAQAMERAGFSAIEIRDRNGWYLETAQYELAQIRGPLHDQLVGLVGAAETDRQTQVWEAMLVVLKSGELRPTHLKAKRPV